MDNFSTYCCLNEECLDYGKRGNGNISIYCFYGEDDQFCLLVCKTCGERFSERKGTPLFNSKLKQKKAVSIFEHLADGCGIRQTARLCKVSKNTVKRYAKLAGEHAKQLHDELVSFSPRNQRNST